MTPTRISVLLTVVRDGPIRLSDLADAESLNPTMLSRIVSGLVERGLLERTSDDEDRRAAWVNTTLGGRRLAKHIRGERTDAINAALEGLSVEHRRLPGAGAARAGGAVGAVQETPSMTRVVRAGRVTFAALSVPNYRRYYGGQAVSMIGTWMQMTAQSWLVLSVTHSSTALGLIVALQTLPVLLLGPYGGVIADRVDKRRLMIALQSAMGLQALALGVLTVTGEVQVWQIGLLAALLGLNNAFENPARQSFMMELVGKEHLRNAVSLNSVLVNVARSIGPAIAGILIATVGDGVCFLANAASFVAVVVSLTTMDAAALSPPPPSPRARGQLRDGLRYVRSMPQLAVPLVMMGVAGCLTYEFQVSLPVMADHGLGVGAAGFGFMTAAIGVGAVAGGLVVAGRGKTGLRPLTRGGVRTRRRAGGSDAGPEPRGGAARAGARRRRQHLVHGDGQLDPAAQCRTGNAGPRDVAVVRRLPGLDADRRTARRGHDGGDRTASRPGPRSPGCRPGRVRRVDRPAARASSPRPLRRGSGRRLESAGMTGSGRRVERATER